MDPKEEFDLMQDAFRQWYADKYPKPAQHEALKLLTEAAFCQGWIEAMERYTSTTFNRTRQAALEALRNSNN